MHLFALTFSSWRYNRRTV